MPKYCFNYDSVEYEYIDKNGYSWDQNDYVTNWDNSQYLDDDDDDIY